MTFFYPEPNGLDRRIHRRVPLAFPAALDAGGVTWSVQARDLSMGGLGLATEIPLPPGARVAVELRLGDERVRADGEVVTRTRVRFTRLDQPALTRILRAVSLDAEAPGVP